MENLEKKFFYLIQLSIFLVIMSTDKFDIYVESFINEGFVETYFIQYYNNKSNNKINIFYNIPINICKEMQFVDFEIEIGDKKIKSKIIPNKEEQIKNELEKDENKNKIDKKDNPQINIVLKPKMSVKFKTHYVQSLVSQELTYIYRLMRKFPNFYSLSGNKPNSLNDVLDKSAPHSLKANIYFQTFSQVSKFTSKVDGGNPNIKYNLKNKMKYEMEITLESIKYTKNEIYDSNIPLISIMFQTENYNVPKLYKQYNPLNDETSYLLSFFKINNNKEKNIKAPSSSMYYLLINEEHINEYSRSICKSLLESLSNDNYFQIIEYQKNVKLYNILPLKCEKENIKNTIKNISFIKNANYNKKNNYNYNNIYKKLESYYLDESIESDEVSKSIEGNNLKNLIESAEQYIDKPFEYIFNLKQKETIDLNKFFYIIGNNLDIDRSDISRLMKKYKNIDKNIQIFIINIIDTNLEIYSLNGIDSSYVETNLSENMFKQIQNSQNEIYDEVKFTLGNKNMNELLHDYNRNEFLSKNQSANYFFTLKGKVSGQIDINNIYKKDESELKDSYSFNESQTINLKEGNILSKIIAHNIIQQKENNEVIKKLSEKYQILSDYTILSVGEEEICKDKKIDNSKIIDDNNSLEDSHIFLGKKKDRPLDDDDNSDLLSKVICSQNFKGSWDENQYTKKIIEMKKDIYDKVTKYYKKKRVAITFTILNYMMSNVDSIYQYTEEIGNAENYLIKNNCPYDSIQQNLMIRMFDNK